MSKKSITLNKSDVLKCPHCGKDPDSSEEDAEVNHYIIPGRAAINPVECDYCYGKFNIVTNDSTPEVTVEFIKLHRI